MLIKLFRTFMQRIDPHRASLGVASHPNRAVDRILQQGCPQFFALRGRGHGISGFDAWLRKKADSEPD